MPLLYYLLLFFTIALSGSSLFLFKSIGKKTLKLMLSFSGAYLFALTVTHLIPEVYSGGGEKAGIFILAGFFIQLILEIFSQGIEHGHIHIHKHQNNAFPYGVMAGLCLHSYLEGMPLSQGFPDPAIQKSLLAGIVLHHIPVAVALMSMLLDSGIKKISSVLFLLLFALMAPMGAFTGQILHDSSLTDLSGFFNNAMALVIGIFLHISTTILFESSEGHKFNYLKFGIILIGAGLAFIH
ncbi:MAG: ZIP family metal transporter [Bacteroidia bacterium]|nr:ZIP family metal transporter [Bacteroidia bacterium]